jgi:hypothetical protein
MLADRRSEALATRFASQWLRLQDLVKLSPDYLQYPQYDRTLADALKRETELLFDAIVRNDRPLLELLTADYTFANERVAKHYGLPNVTGPDFRKVALTDPNRRGLLGHGSILAVTSHAERTSPVLRGKWVLENLLGLPVPPPPPDVPSLDTKGSGTPKTLREQLAEHRASPVCASCHRVMDPVGFALENFDAVGAWRTREPGGPIDASGELADGTAINGAVQLREAIVRRPDLFVSTLTEKMLIYALGRGVEARDMPAVRSIVRDAAARDYRMSAIVLGVVRSVPFRTRTTPAGDEPPAQSARVN